ncbi:MAG TPA: hypothetical protein VG206_17635 [Terriglobia bacterium]|nr:hypothetical protein [Terriglobia bacterium]
MRYRNISLQLAVAASAMLVPANAQMTSDFLTVTGQEVNVSITPGTVECVGGQLLNPPPNPFTFCSPETTQIYIRGQVEKNIYQNLAGTRADLLAGTLEAVDNCNFDGNMTGYCWGTVRWPIPGKGLWEGYWHGEVSMRMLNGKYTFVAFGRDGLEGKQITFEAALAGQPMGTFVARIQVPKPTVTLAVTGPQSGTVHKAGNSFILTITAPGHPNKPVSVMQNGSAPVLLGTTDAQGTWTATGTWGPRDVGSYTQNWYVDGIAATSMLRFSVTP